MAEIKPGVPDYVQEFVVAKRQRGIREQKIEGFVDRWRSLPPDTPVLPCPFCYDNGGWGSLYAIEEGNRVKSLQCRQCGGEIGVNRTP